MATPWWLSTTQIPTDLGTAQGSEAVEIDKRTGQRVYREGQPNNQTGQYYYTLPSGGELAFEDIGNAMRAYTTERNPGQLAPGQDEAARTATFVTDAAKGLAAPYGNLGGEVGVIDGKMTYLYPMDRGASIDGDLGIYGGAQRARWSSPSQSKGTVVKGPDGNFWVAPPLDARFSESDTANHQTMLQGAWQDFGPIIMAAVGGAGVSGGLASTFGGGATGAAAAGATMGGANALLTGGDVAGGILKGGALGGAGYGISNAMSGTGFPAPVQAGTTNFLTGMLGGQSPTQAAVGGAIAGANRAFASPSGTASDFYGNTAGTDYRLSSNNLVPTGGAPLPTVPATTGGKMADDMYGGFGYEDTNAGASGMDFYGNTAGSTNTDYGIPAAQAGAAGGGGIPSWLSNFFAKPGVPGALISGAGGLLAANMTGNAARDAAARSGQASEAATALQAQQYADARARSQPFYNAGVNALAQYQNPELTRPFAMSDFNADPGYGFRMDQGMKALNQSMASKGLGVSGTGIKGAMNFGQNLGSQEYQNAYNRYGQDQATRRNTLANIAGFGPPAAAATTAAGTNYATNAGNMGMGAANTFANADMAAAASQASAYGGIGNALGRAFSPDPMTAAITQMMQRQYGGGLNG
jgi:hypothetical protein